ncbi:aspartyl/asparaginyl beta-hydroxylase domain-containing protein [Oceanicoccus sagamiensis]|uniref:Aspartyl/asparaginy/proline hydroxylase domain-containing protein n=1 Tax=Oceanicoccus sagamiensis TaxID=716816 RepID=A0A1X9NDM2_9GAMM|nr:aspartyl/asparaginyl beta-hydroxylase domain-containing protein [Oceanicoccus sagamiensis]ARN76138.1 hypothetical protein BST96_19770 [Oceanicoccus sagamiensis]
MNIKGDFIKIDDFDITDIKARVLDISEDIWNADAFRQKTFEVHKHTQTIKLIMDEDGRHTGPTLHPIYHELENVITPVENCIRRNYNNTLKAKKLRKKNPAGYFIRMILVRLNAKGIIPKHVDTGETLMKCHRIHLPIITNEKNIFSVGESSKALKAGEIWEINNRHEHGVVNSSDEGRIHLIMDYVLPGEKVKDTDGSNLTC